MTVPRKASSRRHQLQARHPRRQRARLLLPQLLQPQPQPLPLPPHPPPLPLLLHQLPPLPLPHLLRHRPLLPPRRLTFRPACTSAPEITSASAALSSPDKLRSMSSFERSDRRCNNSASRTPWLILFSSYMDLVRRGSLSTTIGATLRKRRSSLPAWRRCTISKLRSIQP